MDHFKFNYTISPWKKRTRFGSVVKEKNSVESCSKVHAPVERVGVALT